jgi:hypothetical protein
VASAVKRALTATVSAALAACLMVGVLGVIAVTGRWPSDAPRMRLEAGGILSFPAERVARVEFSAGERPAIFSRHALEG